MDNIQLAEILRGMPRRPVKIRVEDAVFEIDFVQELALTTGGETIKQAEITADTFGLLVPPITDKTKPTLVV